MIELLEKLQNLDEEDKFEDIFQPLSDEEIDARGLRTVKAIQELRSEIKISYPWWNVYDISVGGFELVQFRKHVKDLSSEYVKKLQDFVRDFLEERGVEIVSIGLTLGKDWDASRKRYGNYYKFNYVIKQKK